MIWYILIAIGVSGGLGTLLWQHLANSDSVYMAVGLLGILLFFTLILVIGLIGAFVSLFVWL